MTVFVGFVIGFRIGIRVGVWIRIRVGLGLGLGFGLGLGLGLGSGLGLAWGDGTRKWTNRTLVATPPGPWHPSPVSVDPRSIHETGSVQGPGPQTG